MISPEGILAFVWVFAAFDTLFFCLKICHMLRRPWRTKETPVKISESCVCLGWFVMMALCMTTTTYDEWLPIHFRNSTDPTIVPGFGMPLKDLIVDWKVSLAGEEGFTTVLWLVKWSFMAIYYPLLEQLRRGYRIAWWIIFCWTIISYVLLISMEFIWCHPIDTLWSIENGCSFWQFNKGLAVGAVLNTGSDLAVLIFPMVIFSSISNKRSERYGIAFLCLIGCFVVAASFTRIGMLAKSHTEIDPNKSIQAIQTATLWGNVELFIAFWVSCLPASRVYAVKAWSPIKSTLSSITGISSRKGSTGGSDHVDTIGGGRAKGGHGPQKQAATMNGQLSVAESELVFMSDQEKAEA